MQKFVANQNILRFKDMLTAETDDARRQLLQRMIAEEEAKLQAEQAASKSGPKP